MNHHKPSSKPQNKISYKMDQYLELVFPAIYSIYGKTSKNSQKAEQLFNLMVTFLKQDKQFFTEEKQRITIHNLLAKSESNSNSTNLKIIFHCQYSSAILLTNKNKEGHIQIQIISPHESSQLGQSRDDTSHNLTFSIESQKSFGEFYSIFNVSLQKCLEQTVKKKKQQKKQFQESVEIIEEACKKALLKQKAKIISSDKSKQNSNKQAKIKEADHSNGKGFKQNKELDQSQANTCWYVTEALIKSLIQKSQVFGSCYKKIIVGFKLFVLQKVTKNRAENSKYDQTQTGNYKKCLDSLIQKYKKQISHSESQIDQACNFLGIVRQINNHLKQTANNGLTSKLEDIENNQAELQFTKYNPSTIQYSQKVQHKKVTAKLALISDYPLKVDKRFPFSRLLELGKKIQKQQLATKDKWILLVEKTFFSYTQCFCCSQQQTIDLNIHMRQIECQIGTSSLCLIVEKYENLVKTDENHFGFGMKGQARSHIQLIKRIASVIAFESVKLNREHKKSNLSKYRPPLNMTLLHKAFISHSYDARKSMKQLVVYFESRKSKLPLFLMNAKSNTFAQFGKIVAEQTRGAHAWVSTMTKNNNLKKQLIYKNIKLQQTKKRLQIAFQCYLKNSGDDPAKNISKINSVAVNTTQNIAVSQFDQTDPWLFAFLENIPSDILGLMKIFMMAQNPQPDAAEKNNLFEDRFAKQQHSIKIFSKKPQQQNKTFNSSTVSVDNIPLNDNFNDVKILFKDGSLGTNVSVRFQAYNDLCYTEKQNKKMAKQLEYILAPPEDEKIKNREHKLYSKLFQKPKEVEIEDFLAIGNVRSGQKTQMMVLCLNILQKKITSNSYDEVCKLAEQTILQTAGQLSAYNSDVQAQFRQIQNMLFQFIDNWAFTDVSFCPVIGPFFGYIGRELIDDGVVNSSQAQKIKQIVFQLVKKCMIQFQRGQEQLRENPKLKIQWNQRFIVTAALSCFRQIMLTPQNENELLTFCRLIFIQRFYKILSDQEEKPEKKRPFETQLIFSLQKATYNNIEVLSEYLNDNKASIGKILKQLDPGFQDDVQWKRDNMFSFSGKSLKSLDIYQIDIFTGKIFINGKQISALNQQIKQNPLFSEIFGRSREFQVFQSHYSHFLRTKNPVNHQFKIPFEEGQVFLQFSEDGKQIRYVYCQNGGLADDQEIWVVLSYQVLKSSNCYFPQKFIDCYLAWYSQKRQCIILRKKAFQQIYHAGMVIHLKSNIKNMEITKAFYITYQGGYENKSINELCDINTKIYEQIVLRDKQFKIDDITVFRLLKRFQKPEYILELRNKKTNQIQYLLERYQIRFRLEQSKKNRLASQTYFGYQLDFSYYTNKNSLFNKFPCLVLKKYSKNPALLNNHKRIVIVSDGRIESGGSIRKPNQPQVSIASFKYQIHDFFGDLRGLTRQSLLHLSSIMLAINDNIKISYIEITPLQYAMHLLKSCLSNIPLSQVQAQKIENIIQRLSPPESVILICEAIWICSKALQTILPFQEKPHQSVFSKLKSKLRVWREVYLAAYQQKSISYRQRINSELLDYTKAKANKKDSSSLPKQKIIYHEAIKNENNEDKFWRKLQKFKGGEISQKIKRVNEQFQQFEKTYKQMNIWNNIEGGQKGEQYVKFSSKIKDLTRNPQANIMTKQMIDQLQQSYETYIDEESKITTVTKKMTNQLLSKLVNLTKQLIQTGTSITNQLQQVFEQIKLSNQNHPDVITGVRPTLSFVFFTQLLCNDNQIQQYIPHATENFKVNLEKAISIWLQLKTRISSLQRIQTLFTAERIDVVSLMREILSPRAEVRQKKHWLCFQAENKVQLWPSQLDTYKNLMNSKTPGAFCQLNMGQGKTQVIIPLIILDIIYSKMNCLPRINLLNSLIEEARGNFFRFLSATGFQIPGFELPFNRKVELSKDNIFTIRNLLSSFSKKSYILMTRQSRLSQILKFYEMNLNDQSISMQKNSIFPCQVFDIFDQIDALMTSVKSYIFSVGKSEQLPQDKLRIEILRDLIEVFLRNQFKQALNQKIITTEETQTDAINFVQRGQYPPGLKLHLQDLSEQKQIDFRRKLARGIIDYCINSYFSFAKWLKPQQIEDLIQFIIDPLNQNVKLPKDIAQTSKDQIYLLRGVIGYGIFQHSFSMRCGIQYGAPNHYHIKRVAVPYQAADIPSKTSQYQQPDVSIILSYLAYYTKGLTYHQFDQTIKNLLTLSKSSKQYEYNQWLQYLPESKRQIINVKNVYQINYNSKALKQELFKFYRRNRRVIYFWLSQCVFNTNLKQYNKSICASAWDLADVQNSVGFSGTKDNHWLFSQKLKWKPCQSPSIKATDGKMIYLIAKFTNSIHLIQQNQKTQWQRFIDLALSCKVGCIIDAGALCVGKSLQKQIVPWVAKHKSFLYEKYAGISFCDQNGKWKVYDIQSKHYIPRGRSIPDHETFVIFDDARTRGADLKMNSDVIAAMSLGPHMTKDKFMQAAGRLRRLGRDQSLIIMATQQIFATLQDFPKHPQQIKSKILSTDTAELTNLILSWCCKNSIQLNQTQLTQFASLGWTHIKSKINKKVHQIQINNTLSGMYESYLQKTTVAIINQKYKKILKPEYVQSSSGKQIVKILENYGKNVFKMVGSGSPDDVCQREIENEKQKQQQDEDDFYQFSSISEYDNPKMLPTLAEIPLTFDQKFVISENFIQTTLQDGPSFVQKKAKELSQLYFLIYDEKIMKTVTLRQASLFIDKYIIKQQNGSQNISMLNSLSIEDEFIAKNNLQKALVSAKFLAGTQNYSQQEQNYLLQILMQSSRNKKQWQTKFQNLTSVILKKKRIFTKKYFGSTLEQIVIRLENESVFDKGNKQTNKKESISKPSSIIKKK